MSKNINWFQDSFWFGEIFLKSLRGSVFDPLLSVFVLVFHYLGETFFFMALLSIVYVYIDRKLGIRLGVGLLTTAILNAFLKILFESPRPTLLWNGPGKLTELSYGFPSGHVQTTVVIWGLLLLHLKSKTARLISVLVIVFMPFARMYAGVHFAGDVLGGFIFGLLGLVLIEIIFRVFPELESYTPFDGQTFSKTKTMALIVVVMTLPSVLLHTNINSYEKIKSYENVISASGALGGFLIGILFSKMNSLEWGKAETIQEGIQRAVILILGILLLYVLPGILIQKYLPENPVARYLRYGIVSSYIAFFSVKIMVKSKGRFKK
ncbi:phosphatase PAP2 family protein [Leptospira noguchii]|uniref:PAP2 family protein n=1 Tax=Leptospira noguchii serovar Autumnalis str. ZUN142 TaxID=1085540 RepID=M6UMI3_9LEPT|nr:phosphatase PAP2 family protein [Leptospira noguchii]EMO42264.1 PAP2 family protein [Leptospira noguchii serovar Autumnalis str. ZUN142]EMS88469.1 PAP2 family protein [Leptospira noguchii str. Hook]TQE77566.1 phosphatase PAP2 family protein [Leptospira noguchii]UOG47850.1 phosphatase PAP2 family protein [Leptospira noguchii]UOG51727.1 phosphatase PAP2 family protein [Leptospira noguchii]